MWGSFIEWTRDIESDAIIISQFFSCSRNDSEFYEIDGQTETLLKLKPIQDVLRVFFSQCIERAVTLSDELT